MQPRWKRRATEIADAIGGGSSSVTIDNATLDSLASKIAEQIALVTLDVNIKTYDDVNYGTAGMPIQQGYSAVTGNKLPFHVAEQDTLDINISKYQGITVGTGNPIDINMHKFGNTNVTDLGNGLPVIFPVGASSLGPLDVNIKQYNGTNFGTAGIPFQQGYSAVSGNKIPFSTTITGTVSVTETNPVSSVPVSVGNATVPVSVGNASVPFSGVGNASIPFSGVGNASVPFSGVGNASVPLSAGQTVDLSAGQTVDLSAGQTVDLSAGQTVTLAANQTVQVDTDPSTAAIETTLDLVVNPGTVLDVNVQGRRTGTINHTTWWTGNATDTNKWEVLGTDGVVYTGQTICISGVRCLVNTNAEHRTVTGVSVVHNGGSSWIINPQDIHSLNGIIQYVGTGFYTVLVETGVTENQNLTNSANLVSIGERVFKDSNSVWRKVL